MSDSFRRFLAALEEAVEWCKGLGIRIDPSRFTEYIETVQGELDSTDDLPSKTNPVIFHSALTAIEAGSELLLIRRALGHLRTPELCSRLKKYIRGTTLEVDEDLARNTHHPRNFGFELVFGAQLAEAGLPVDLPPNGDLLIENPQVYIECKRLHSVQHLPGALQKAVRQLRKRIPCGHKPAGIVAFSVGKLIHRGELLLAAPDAAAMDRELSAILNDFRQNYAGVWHRKPLRLVQAVALHISVNVHITTDNTWLWGNYLVINHLEHNCNRQHSGDIEAVATALRGIAGTTRY